MLLLSWILRIVGFGAQGPIAGSAAARWMASIAINSAGVAQGSLYAILQSIAMGGAVPAWIVIGGVAIAGVTVAAMLAHWMHA
ncbi:hypothetical protein V8C86DRAFT_2527731 [Haematococcus lacustris]